MCGLILCNMGRISKKVVCNSLSLKAHGSETSSTHPYRHQLNPQPRCERVKPTDTHIVPDDSSNKPKSNDIAAGFHSEPCVALRMVDSTTTTTTPTPTTNIVLPTEGSEKQSSLLVNSQASNISVSTNTNYMDDSWSPFNSPAVQKCLRAQPQQLSSLLERRERTTTYTPPNQPFLFGQQTHGPYDPGLFRRTYVGYTQAPESITLSVVDVETGEFLCQRPTW